MKKSINIIFICLFIFFISFLLLSCSTKVTQGEIKEEGADSIRTNDNFANVISVKVNGSENSYTFSVEIKSPDKGCKQYANWWEIISESGELIYRRILAHSHVNEQPFVRSGGPVKISSKQTVIIRGHMNNIGYGKTVLKGSVSKGFKIVTIDLKFANELEQQPPLPQDCTF